MNGNEQPGPTGEFPNRKLNKYDEEELAIAITADMKNGVIIIDFNKEIGWLGLTSEEAYSLSATLFQKAKEIEGEI